MQKADSNSSAGYVADSSTKDEDMPVSSHDTKPNVSGLPLSRQFEDIILEIENILSSGQTPFCKTFAIADLVSPEIIYNIDVPEVEMSEWSRSQLHAM